MQMSLCNLFNISRSVVEALPLRQILGSLPRRPLLHMVHKVHTAALIHSLLPPAATRTQIILFTTNSGLCVRV